MHPASREEWRGLGALVRYCTYAPREGHTSQAQPSTAPQREVTLSIAQRIAGGMQVALLFTSHRQFDEVCSPQGNCHYRGPD
jgi:hypothetical protein